MIIEIAKLAKKYKIVTAKDETPKKDEEDNGDFANLSGNVISRLARSFQGETPKTLAPKLEKLCVKVAEVVGGGGDSDSPHSATFRNSTMAALLTSLKKSGWKSGEEKE